MTKRRGVFRAMFVLLGISLATSERCASNPEAKGSSYLPCGEKQAACAETVKYGQECCYWDDGANRNCWVDTRKFTENGAQNVKEKLNVEYLRYLNKNVVKKSRESQDELKNQLQMANSALGNKEQVGSVSSSAQSNALNKGLHLASNPSSFPGLNGAYPECPVHVKVCYRIPCGGFNNRHLDLYPSQCLSDPRCCFDFNLAFMRHIFSSRFMAGAPVCYYGATSKQWSYITSFFAPWNPWKAGLVLEVFEEIFDTNAFSRAGQFLCEIKIQRKAYPVGAKSKLQCNLVSGCWDETLPEGSRCLMASELIQEIFGQTEVYPSLFTNDPSDAKCSSDWSDYTGSRAYSRMPCGIGSPPASLVDMLFSWCPSSDCCLNYADIDYIQLSSLSALQYMFNTGVQYPSFGGPLPGFNFQPGNTTPFNPQTFAYLMVAQDSDSLANIFCPFQMPLELSIFPDMSEDISGCCVIPTCYHRKQLVDQFRPTPTPATWGSWSNCAAACGQLGIQSRECYRGAQHQPGLCPGTDTRSCSSKPCQVQYEWGQWQQMSPCSRSCGEGFIKYKRTCYSNSQAQNSRMCAGGASTASKTEPCNRHRCPESYKWSDQLVRLNSCSVTCGRGSEIWGHRCLDSGGRIVSEIFCSGSSQRQHQICELEPCRPQASWGSWYQISQCGATCGVHGLRKEKRACLFSDRGLAPNQACGREQSERVVRCKLQDCGKEYYWVGWFADPCTVDQAGMYCTREFTRTLKMTCFDNGPQGGYVEVQPQSLCGPPRTKTVQCDPEECRREELRKY